jgi:hypothetical protein
MTGQEIINVLEESELPVEAFANDDPEYGVGIYIYNPETDEERELNYDEVEEMYNTVKEKLGGWTQVEQKGGEGQGDEWYSITYFPAHDVYIRTDGFYTSYHGTDFDDFGKEVRPQEKVITVYE